MRAVPYDVQAAWANALPAELALVGELEMLLQGRSDLGALDCALAHLKERSGAAVAELFLASPDDREVFLVSHQGPDLEAFSRQDRFAVGEGFPGMVLSSNASLITDQLPREQGFLRSRVKTLGYSCALCTRLAPEADVSGSILLTRKEPAWDMASVLRLAILASVPIGRTVDLMRAHLRLDQLQHLATHNGAPMAGNGNPCLRFIDPDAQASDCPAERACRIQVLGVRKGWPSVCRAAGCTASARYCIPLRRGAAVWAVATVAFRTRTPIPHTRHVPETLWLTEDLAPSDAQGVVATRSTAPQPNTEARLLIRCFGGFAISLDGRLIEQSHMGRQKARELLALLISTAGRPRTLEYLAQQLWPNVPIDRARNRFHVTLSTLRRVIEPTDGHGVLHIRRDGQRYSLDPDSSVFVDLWYFHQLIRQALAAKRSIEQELALLEEVLALYSGEVFAGEFAGAWCDDVVANAQERAMQVVGDLAEARLKCSQVSQALAVLRRADEIAPRRAQADARLRMLRTACMQRQSPPPDLEIRRPHETPARPPGQR